jgi:tetratricopeptide (TPR) repeat protein
MKKHVIFFQIIFYIIFFISCDKKEKPIIYKSTDKSNIVIKNKWLADEKNIEDPTYQAKFLDYYQNGIATKNYDQSCEALFSVFDLMEIRGIYEPFYVKKLTDFLKKYDSNISPFYYGALYRFLATDYFNKMDYKQSLFFLNKAKSFIPFDYDTYTEMGYIYNYISNCYTFTGDYVLALEYTKSS